MLVFWCSIGIMGFFAIYTLAETIFSSPPHTAMNVCITIFIYIPGTIIALWTKMYRVKVDGTNISVRKRFGLVNFKLKISDITNVKWDIVDTNFGRIDTITVFTSKGKTFKVGAPMVNDIEFIKLIEDNIEEHKISQTYKSVVKR